MMWWRWSVADRGTWLKCRAANAFQIAAMYRDEAESCLRELRKASPDDRWTADIDSPLRGPLPDDWATIAELPEPVEVGRG